MTAPLRRRTRAREIAMQALFQFDLRGPEYATEAGSSVADVCRTELFAGQGFNEHGVANTMDRALNAIEREVIEFAARLVDGTLQHRDDIDALLQGVTRNWDLRRMAIVDRNVLRMAVFELKFCADVPPKVTINEAIEIGKKFSTANSGGFVNGILDRIRIDLVQQRTAEKAAGSKKDAEAANGASASEEQA